MFHLFKAWSTCSAVRIRPSTKRKTPDKANNRLKPDNAINRILKKKHIIRYLTFIIRIPLYRTPNMFNFLIFIPDILFAPSNTVFT